LLHYRLVEKIGEGGMGVVWRAADTRLDREVAVKVLPEAFSLDADRLARFEREAKLLAALNHPNIAAIYGVEQAGGVRFLVLELVGGESLDAALGRGPLPQQEALRAGEEIAAGLQAAHDQGILHRDLKPANIRRTPEGRVKILDFGLAKALVALGPSGDPAMSPTITHQGTIAGSILGTASYMSPEQARGRSLDRRSDVWSFGCVLFESLSGMRAFPGETISDVIARVIQSEPDWEALPATLHPGVRRLLVRCLQKDPERRLRDIGDARLEILEALAAPAGAGREASAPAIPAEGLGGPSRSRTVAAVAGVALAIGVVAGALAGRMATAPAPTGTSPAARLDMVLPADAPLAAGSFVNPLALSPDGRYLVYVWSRTGVRSLFLRDMTRFDVTPMSGTDGAEGPFFSPDGQWVVFHADGRLKRISVRGGLPQTILETVDYRGATWGPDGTIILSPGQQVPLVRLPVSGGEPRPLSTIASEKGEWGHRYPQFLPGRETVIFASHEAGFNVEGAVIYAMSLRTGERKFLMRASSDTRYVPTGHLVFVQGGVLLAVPFDADRLEVKGAPRPLAEGVVVQKNTGAAYFTISDNGVLVYAYGEPVGGVSEIYWVGQGKAAERYPAETALYRWPRLSPDGRRLALQIIGSNVQGTWVAATGSSDFTKLTDGWGPVWSPSGDRLYFTMNRENSLRWKRSDGSKRPC
jgi:serine/threonine-protein kinase